MVTLLWRKLCCRNEPINTLNLNLKSKCMNIFQATENRITDALYSLAYCISIFYSEKYL